MLTAEEIFNSSTKSGEAYEFGHDTRVIPVSVAIKLAKQFGLGLINDASNVAYQSTSSSELAQQILNLKDKM